MVTDNFSINLSENISRLDFNLIIIQNCKDYLTIFNYYDILIGITLISFSIFLHYHKYRTLIVGLPMIIFMLWLLQYLYKYQLFKIVTGLYFISIGINI